MSFINKAGISCTLFTFFIYSFIRVLALLILDRLSCQALMLHDESPAPRDELEPCCSPTSYYTMSILHASRDGLIKVRHVPDLQVRSCGCRD